MRIHFILILLMLAFMPAKAQVRGLPVLQHFNLENGLPDNNVYSMMTDHNGYLWMCTENGVVKYDGYSFKVFTTRDGLPLNDVWKLEEDDMGRIWLFSHVTSLGYIKNDEYKKINIPLKGTTANRPIMLTRGNKRVCYLLSLDNYTVAIVAIDSSDNFHMLMQRPSEEVMPLFEEGDKFYTILSVKSAKGHRIKILKLWVEHNVIKYTVVDDNTPRELFINTNSSSMYNTFFTYYFRKDFFNTYNLATRKHQYIPLKEIGLDSQVCYLMYGKQDSLYLITTKSINTLDKNFKITNSEQFRDIFPGHVQVADKHYDQFKNTWYTTNNNGIWMKPVCNNVFVKNRNFDSTDSYRFLGKVEEGETFWWSPSDKRLIVLDKTGNKIVHTNIVGDDVKRISRADSNTVYISTNAMVLVYNYRTGKYHDFIENYEGVSVDGMSDEFKDAPPKSHMNLLAVTFQFLRVADNKWYCNSTYTGVLSLQKDSSKISGKFLTPRNRYINVTYDKRNNSYWFYNLESLLEINPETDKYHLYDKEALKLFGINTITSLRLDDYGNYYIQSGNNLYMANLSKQTIRKIRLNINPGSCKVCIYKNRLYIAGSYGMGYADIRGPMDLGSFKFAPNIQHMYYKKLNAFSINNYGTIYLNTNDGVYTLHADEFEKNKLLSAEEDIMKLVLNLPRQLQAADGDTVSLTQDVQSIKIDAINMAGEGNKIYTYKISESTWKNTESGELYTGKLKAGKYYMVQYIIRDDLWISNVHSFVIYVKPYWWQTTAWYVVFWLLGGLLLLGSVIVIIFITRYYSGKSNEKKNRLLDLELRAVYAQINPHFIFNTLSSAQFFIYKKSYDEAYAHVNKFSKLLRAYLKSSQERYVTLAEEIAMLRGYIELQQTRFEEKFAYTIEVENKIAADSLKIPSLLLQPLVENAINHGLFHRKSGGILNIRFWQGRNNTELVCTIEDNGVGRARSQEIKDESLARTESYGTQLTSRLIDIFKEYEGMNIDIQYIDKQLPETGTIVRLIIRNLKYDA